MSDRDFRLSKDVMPVRYGLRIEVDLDNWRFSASEQIDVRVQRPVTTVALHAIDLEIRSATATAAGTSWPATVTFNTEAEIAILEFPEPLPAGSARLEPS